jgi:hypothetical protein
LPSVDSASIETYPLASMSDFKRNQVEEALARILNSNAGRPTPMLRMKVKRLLQADRDLGQDKRDADPERAHYAFYSAEPPGTGVDIGFSQYDAFALLTGLRLLEHGWPQGTVVSDLRKVRPRLEKEHARILKRPFEPLDLRRAAERAKPGDLVLDNTDPVFLCVVTGPRQAEAAQPIPRSIELFRGQAALMKEMLREAGRSFSIFELATPAHQLRAILANTAPRNRGRASA